MLRIGFAFNVNIQRCEIEVGDEKRIIDEGYVPLIDALRTHGIRANFFCSGYSSLLMKKLAPETLGALVEEDGRLFEIGTYTYTHPIPQLLTEREFFKQLERGLAIDERIFGQRPAGFLPPEFAYTGEMARALKSLGVEWTVVLASRFKEARPEATTAELHTPHRVKIDAEQSILAVPAVYQLPDTPARYFKRMMKGEVSVDTVLRGVRLFAEESPGAFLLFKRDAETVFIDRFNSGFEGTREVMDEFFAKLRELPDVEFVNIGQIVREASRQELVTIELDDYLGNTTIETYTAGEARPLWDKTVLVRERLEVAEREGTLPPVVIEEAWENLLLSHNSDGRIGYWFSEWNPGEHKVAPSRRYFVDDHLSVAARLLGLELE